VTKSSRHQKITGDFAEMLVLYWLSKSGYVARLLRNAEPGLQLSEHIEHEAAIVFEHACKLGLEGIVCRRTRFARV
jgi:hypothetical protein